MLTFMCQVLLELSIFPHDLHQQMKTHQGFLTYVGLKVHTIDFYHLLGFLEFQSYHMIIMNMEPNEDDCNSKTTKK